MADFSKEIGNSVNALLEREGSLMTGSSHLQARDILKNFKKKYLDAVEKNDKSEIQNVKNLTKKMAQGVARWQTIGEQVPDINNNFGWTKGMTKESGNIIAGVSSGQFDLNVDDKTGEVTLGIQTGDSKKKQPVTSKQFDEAVSSGIKPLPFIQGVLERGNNMYQAGNKGNNEFNYDAIYSENKMKIQAGDSPSIQSMLYDEIIPGQPPIVTHLENHPELEGYEGTVKKTVIEALAQGAHGDITTDLLAKAFTAYDKKSFESGKAAYDEKNKAMSEDEEQSASTKANTSTPRQSLVSRISSAFQKLTKK
jgi:hypothetical protein